MSNFNKLVEGSDSNGGLLLDNTLWRLRSQFIVSFERQSVHTFLLRGVVAKARRSPIHLGTALGLA